MILRRVIDHFRRQEWTAVFLDFVIVVVGVIVGLQVNNWSEARKDRVRERAYLMRVAAELDQSIVSLEKSVELTKLRAAYGEFLLDSIESPERVSAEPGRFIAAVTRSPRRGFVLSGKAEEEGELPQLDLDPVRF